MATLFCSFRTFLRDHVYTPLVRLMQHPLWGRLAGILVREELHRLLAA